MLFRAAHNFDSGGAGAFGYPDVAPNRAWRRWFLRPPASNSFAMR